MMNDVRWKGFHYLNLLQFSEGGFVECSCARLVGPGFESREAGSWMCTTIIEFTISIEFTIDHFHNMYIFCLLNEFTYLVLPLAFDLPFVFSVEVQIIKYQHSVYPNLEQMNIGCRSLVYFVDWLWIFFLTSMSYLYICWLNRHDNILQSVVELHRRNKQKY